MHHLPHLPLHPPPLLLVLPFLLVLLSIAVLPLVAHHWWEPLKRKALVCFLLAAPTAVLYFLNDRPHLLHTLHEYISFVCLLGSLYVISGGIVLRGDIRAKPAVTTGFLAVGALLANLIGTTGASMLLIRPILQTMQERQRTKHIPVFFIFLVSNIGGCLTPLADPPLFLGFLRGVPFRWTFRLLPEWLFAVSALLALFYLIERLAYRKEKRIDRVFDLVHIEPIRVVGFGNFGGLLGVLLLILLAPSPWREAGMVVLATLSYTLTPRALHERNRFSFYPIKEVAILFLGIFVTMIPALVLLEERGGSLGIVEPWQYFWATGLLSSFLDNAPTYLTFTSLALGVVGLPGDVARPLLQLVDHVPGETLLRAISVGAVFMGANTYIGNGPNFMVKSICEDRGVSMPSFFGFMLWSGAILMPLFVVVTLVFFRG